MATRFISTRIALDGEAEFKKQMSEVNGELRNLSSEMKLSETQFKGQANSMEALTAKDKLLRQEIEQQEEKVRALNGALEDATKAYGENDSRTDKYRQQLNRAKTELITMNRELEENGKYLDEAKKSSDGCAKSIDGFGKSTKEGGGLLEQFGGKLKGLGVAGAAGLAVAGLKAVVDAAFEVVEATEEYRKVMGTLEVSSQKAGYSAEETAQTFSQLHDVLGDTQTAATTTANLQALGLSQEQLTTLTDAAIGAWATYGDSIPIDGLAEAINETVQVGKVTGTFADVLNWAGESEDKFNEKLEACSDASERANLVLQMMAEQGLAETGQAWKENNQDIVANNQATAQLEAAQAKLGEKLVPLTSKLKTLGAEGLLAVLDAGEEVWDFFVNDVPAFLDATDEYFQELPQKLAEVVEEFGQIGRDVVNGFINGIKEKWNSAVSAVTGFVDDVKGLFTGKSGFDIHSPSKWSEEIGAYMMEGLAVGMENGKGEVMESVEDILNEVKRRFDSLEELFDLNQDVGDLNYELWELTEGKSATESEKYRKQLEMLEGQQRDQAAVVEAAEAAYKSVAEQYGENSAESLAYQKTLLQEQIEYEKLIQKIQEVSEARWELLAQEREGSALLGLSGDGVKAGNTAGGETTQGGSKSAATAKETGKAAENFTANLTVTLDGAVVARNQYKYNKREETLRGESLVEVMG